MYGGCYCIIYACYIICWVYNKSVMCIYVDNVNYKVMMETMEYVIKLPSKEQISIWTNDYLKHFNLREPHQIQILFRVLDHITDLKQDTNGGTGLSLTIASAVPIANKSQGNQPDYNPKNIILQAHSMI